jgi:hypothetical protein
MPLYDLMAAGLNTDLMCHQQIPLKAVSHTPPKNITAISDLVCEVA